jgi:hypothetical protein
MRDFSHLDALAVDYATLDMEYEVRERAYQELYQGTFEYLFERVPLFVEGLEKVDIVSMMAENQFKTWINFYKPSRKKFTNYISRYARDACKNVFRDTRGANPSRRMYESYQRIKNAIHAGGDPDTVLKEHLYHSGDGLILVKRIEDLLKTDLDPLSMSESMSGGKDEDGRKINLEDTLRVEASEVYELERTPAIQIEPMPKRYRALLEQLRPGTNMRLHELEFERKGMRLIDKLAMLDTAYRLAVQIRMSQ